MSDGTTIDWTGVTAEERNAVCAQFMPPSEVNPLRSWHHFVSGKDTGSLMVRSMKDALEWHNVATRNDYNWERITGYRAELRSASEVRELLRHVRYTDTPGGAWDLIEQLQLEAWGIAMNWHKGTFQVMATRDAITWSVKGVKRPCELMGALFLQCNHVAVIWPDVQIKPFDF